MSVIVPGGYVEGMTKVVYYAESEAEDYHDYCSVLQELRSAGCTITPLAYNDPQNLRMLLYVPNHEFEPKSLRSEQRCGHKINVDPLARIQILSSLYHMCRIGVGFNFPYESNDLYYLAWELARTRTNVAVSTTLPDDDDPVTVFGVPYYMLYSEKFEKPILKHFNVRNDYSALRLAAFLMPWYFDTDVTFYDDNDVEYLFRFNMKYDPVKGNQMEALLKDDSDLGWEYYSDFVKYTINLLTDEMLPNTYLSHETGRIAELSRNTTIASSTSIISFL